VVNAAANVNLAREAFQTLIFLLIFWTFDIGFGQMDTVTIFILSTLVECPIGVGIVWCNPTKMYIVRGLQVGSHTPTAQRSVQSPTDQWQPEEQIDDVATSRRELEEHPGKQERRH
jgi:hypothetical protein